MKLIDAEKFASGIALMEMSFLESRDGKETEYKRGAIATMEAIKKVLLEEVPADYDVDKVVEQLNDKFRVVRTDEDLEWNRAMDEAITIVKGGGVNAKTDS